MIAIGAPPSVETKDECFQSVGNLLFNCGNSWRSNRELRPLTRFAKVMNMIGHHFKFQYFIFQFFGDLIGALIQAFINAINHHFAAVIRTNGNLVFTGEYLMTVVLEPLYIAHMFYYKSLFYLYQGLCFISPRESRGLYGAVW
jgi:hypothetical protein